MQLVLGHGDEVVDVTPDKIMEADFISIFAYQDSRFRMLIFEKDGVLRVKFDEPVIIVTEDEDLDLRAEGVQA